MVLLPVAVNAALIARFPPYKLIGPPTLIGLSTVNVPPIVAVTLPVPVIPALLATKELKPTESDRLNVNEALSVTAPVPSVPVVPPAPTCKVPTETMVLPVYVLAAERINIPDPNLLRLVEPLITPLMMLLEAEELIVKSDKSEVRPLMVAAPDPELIVREVDDALTFPAIVTPPAVDVRVGSALSRLTFPP